MDDAPVRGRVMTWLAVGFLVLDGALLLLAGLWGGQAGLVVGGVTCLVGAGAVWALWQRHRRAVAELAEARRAVRDEARALRDLLRM
jgi:hypothetical protein